MAPWASRPDRPCPCPRRAATCCRPARRFICGRPGSATRTGPTSVFFGGPSRPLGETARHDTLLRVAFSEGRGTDLRVDTPSWWMWQVYGEAGRYVENPQTVASFEARAGRSFRLDRISRRLVATPFLALTGGYDSLLATPEAVGAGPGVNLRYWFREDT